MKDDMYSPVMTEELQRYLLPTDEETSILRLVLLEDPKSVESWEGFCQSHPDPRQTLGSLEGRYRRMLAFVHNGLARNNIELPKQWESYFRIALTRETARAIAYWKQTSEVLDYLQENEVPALLIRGAGPALQVYQDEAPRHSHDVDLLVAPSLLTKTCTLLEEKQFIPRDFVVKGEHRLLGMQHPSELEFVLHTAVTRYDGSSDGIDELRSEAQKVTGPIEGKTFPALSPTMCLLHLLHQFYEVPSEKSLYLFMDLFYLTRRPSLINLDRLSEEVESRRLCLGCNLALTFLDRIDALLDDNLRSAFEDLGASAVPLEYARATELLRYDKWRILRVLARGEGFNRIPIDYFRKRLAIRFSMQPGKERDGFTISRSSEEGLPRGT